MPDASSASHPGRLMKHGNKDLWDWLNVVLTIKKRKRQMKLEISGTSNIAAVGCT